MIRTRLTTADVTLAMTATSFRELITWEVDQDTSRQNDQQESTGTHVSVAEELGRILVL